MKKVIEVALPEYDNLMVVSTDGSGTLRATGKTKQRRRPNRKPRFPKTIKVHLRNAEDADSLAKLLERPLKTDPASRKIAFAAKIDRATNQVVIKSRYKQSDWKFIEGERKKYRPKLRRKWNRDTFYRDHWIDMVPFDQEPDLPWLTYQISFSSDEDLIAFAKVVKQVLSATKSIWHPDRVSNDYTKRVWVGTKEGMSSPRYPIFIVSAERPHIQLTARSLMRMGLKFYVMVEPQEYEVYRRLMPENATVLKLSAGNHGNGPGVARNACWNYAKDVLKQRRFWCMDDNIDGWYRLHVNHRYRCGDGTPFRVLEDFVDRYENVPLAGFQYRFFKAPDHKHFPFMRNTRIYSCALMATGDENFKQRGRYNEDTIQSIDIMKSGQCTVEFNCFLQGKIATQTMGGGNTAKFYAPEGKRNRARSTLNKSEMLLQIHGDVCEMKFAYGRFHHSCDYSQYRDVQLKRTAVWIQKMKNQKWKSTCADPYGMKLVASKT